MASFNKVILMGNLTRDPEVRTTPKGTAIANLGIAVNREWKDEAGQKREEVSFIDVEAFGKQAEVIQKYFAKGKPILIEGRLKLDQWEDKESGQKRSKLKVVLESFSFLPGGNRDGANGGEGGESSGRNGGGFSAPRSESPAGGGRQQAPKDMVDEDVPFGHRK